MGLRDIADTIISTTEKMMKKKPKVQKERVSIKRFGMPLKEIQGIIESRFEDSTLRK